MRRTLQAEVAQLLEARRSLQQCAPTPSLVRIDAELLEELTARVQRMLEQLPRGCSRAERHRVAHRVVARLLAERGRASASLHPDDVLEAVAGWNRLHA